MAIDSIDYKEKDIKYNISLNNEQKLSKGIILENKVAFITGAAGSGKTLLACQIALDSFFKKTIKKIVITRPLVTAGENLGYLPGGIDEKTDPFLQAIYQNFYMLYKKEKIKSMIEEGVIEVVPFAFMRGLTYQDTIVIADEIQNTTVAQCKLILERLGLNSKLLLTGDIKQKDLNKSISSGIEFLEYLNGTNLPGFIKIELLENHRDPLVEDVLDIYEEFEGKVDVNIVKERIQSKYKK